MLIGTRLNGRYKVLEMIGGGGMANVYLARDVILDRNVAVKVLRPDFSTDDEFIKRFHREAHSTTSLDHPNIVSIYDVGEEEGIYFIVMEYVDGQTLKQFIQQNGPVPVGEAIRIMDGLLSAIEHAHLNQIVHRDIKPHNILIDEDKNIKVTDFGIAMALSATSITQTNSVLGSVHYISPEQARGGMANKKSDIYSLGIVMFELLTGRLPFSGESAVSIALKHLQSETPPPKRWNPDIPQSVENIILKATAKDPFLRYDSVEEMKLDLETCLDPGRLNEPKFVLPLDDEKTKAIPIITNDQEDQLLGETIDLSKDKTLTKKSGKKPAKRRRLIPLLFSVLLLMGIGGVGLLYVLPAYFAEEDIIIPDMAGQEVEASVAMLKDLGLAVEIEERYDPEIPQGKVIETDPSASSAVKKGFIVIIYKSLGQEEIEFENYVGQRLDAVKKQLLLKGIKEDNIKAYPKDSNRPENEIIVQVQPKPGQLVNPKEMENMTIFFEVSKGPVTKMPNMTGWSEKEVLQFVEKNKLFLDSTNEPVFSKEQKEGTVVQYTPEKGTELKRGDKVGVTLSKGAPPKKITVSKVIPFEAYEEKTEQRVDIYIGDAENSIENIYRTDILTASQEISFEVTVPFNGEATYKIYRDGEFFVSDVIRYD